MESILALGIPMWMESLGEWWLTGLMGIILYWVPLITCLIVYLVKGVNLFFKLRQDRVGDGKYLFFRPDELTVGHIVAFTFISICPGINLIAFFVETGWKVLRFIVKKFEFIFTMSLVPDSKKYEGIRKEKNII